MGNCTVDQNCLAQNNILFIALSHLDAATCQIVAKSPECSYMMTTDGTKGDIFAGFDFTLNYDLACAQQPVPSA